MASQDRELEYVIAAINSGVRESIVLTDAELREPGPRIVYVNGAFTRTTGYEAHEVLGRSPRFLQGRRTDRAQTQRLRECLAQGQSFEGETFNYKKDGTEFINNWYIVPIVRHGRIVRYLSVQRDVTVQRRVGAVAEARHFFDHAAPMMAAVRHELANPINSFKAGLTLLRRRIWDIEAAKVMRYLERMQVEVQRMEYVLKLLSGFHADSRADLRDIDLASFLELFGRLLDESQPRLDISIAASESDYVVRADPRMLHQVLMNLVTNARQALEGMDTPYIGVHAAPLPDAVQITVSDNGPGVSPEIRGKLFNPFWTTKQEGSGLGLSISRQLMTRMNGTISLESDAARGTRVQLILERGTTLQPLPSSETFDIFFRPVPAPTDLRPRPGPRPASSRARLHASPAAKDGQEENHE